MHRTMQFGAGGVFISNSAPTLNTRRRGYSEGSCAGILFVQFGVILSVALLVVVPFRPHVADFLHEVVAVLCPTYFVGGIAVDELVVV